MKKFAIQAIVLIIIIIGALYAGFRKPQFNFDLFNGTVISQPTKQIKKTEINGIVINVEVADTPQFRTKGLSDRSSLAGDWGMLFIFPENKKYRFWMRNMKFPLDFIFIRDDEVVDILKNIPNPDLGQEESTLPLYEPVVPINKLLEVNAGFTDSNKIIVGDKVRFIN